MFGMVCFADQGMSGASVPCWVTLRLIQTRAVRVVNVGPGAPDEHTGHPGHSLSLLVMLFLTRVLRAGNAAADLLLW